MNTCGTCKHFGEVKELDWYDADSDDEGVIVKFHVCNLLKHLNENNESRRMAEAATAGTIDGSGYYAALCVSAEFGCNQWAERTPVQPAGDE